MPLALSAWVMLAVLAPTMARAQSEAPVKLAVVTDDSQLAAGTTAAAQVVIQDALNQPVDVARPTTISFEAVYPSGRTETKQVTVRPGERGTSVSFELKEPGILRLRASHDHLLDGESLVLVRPPAAERAERSAMRRHPAVARAERSAMRRAPAVEARSAPTATRARPPEMPRESLLGVGRSPVVSPAPPPPPPTEALAPPQPGARLTLRVTPQRPILADESDAATVYAFLDREASDDIQLRLSASLGSLAPVPIRIEKGQAIGQSRFTSKDVGSAEVTYEGSTSAVEFSGDKLRIDFGPPIHKIELDPSPSEISLVETTRLVARLSDHNGVPQATDRERRVHLTREGPAEIALDEVVIPAGQTSSSTVLRPTGLGTITLSASTAGLTPADAQVRILFPWLVLILCLLGGAAGGWMAMLAQKPARGVRILVGVVTGLVVYWVFVFGLVDVPPGAAVHPLGAFSIPTLGGFLGTQAFTWIFKRLGIEV